MKGPVIVFLIGVTVIVAGVSSTVHNHNQMVQEAKKTCIINTMEVLQYMANEGARVVIEEKSGRVVLEYPTGERRAFVLEAQP